MIDHFLAIGDWLLAIGDWRWAIGDWLLAIGDGLLAMGTLNSQLLTKIAFGGFIVYGL